MTEHQKINAEEYERLMHESRDLTTEELGRVIYHLVWGRDHYESIYSHVGGDETNPQSGELLKQDSHAHQAAILRGEVSAEDLWQGDLD